MNNILPNGTLVFLKQNWNTDDANANTPFKGSICVVNMYIPSGTIRRAQKISGYYRLKVYHCFNKLNDPFRHIEYLYATPEEIKTIDQKEADLMII